MLEEESKATAAKLKERNAKCSKTEQRISDADELHKETTDVLEDVAEAVLERFSLLETMRGDALGDALLTVGSCDNRERDMRDWLQARIDAEDLKIKRLAEKIIKAMTEYKQKWVLETREVDVNLASGPEFKTMITG